MATTTDTNLSKLTPEEFTNFFMEGLKQELSTYELQANKVGFLGYLVNMLGNVTYDSKIYKDMLFKEAFPATAQQDDNIYLHGSIYGFKNSLSTPAIANGTIQFDFSVLPAPVSNVKSQKVVFGTQVSSTNQLDQIPIQINVDNVIFSSKSTYTFVRENNSYKTVVHRADGTVSTYPSNNQILTVELDNFRQERPETVEFVLPSYNYGSYYTYTFSVPDEFISDIIVEIKMPDDLNYVRYDISKVKYLIESSSKTVFFNQVASDTYTIEFGSGIHGNWVPGASVRVSLYKTIGVSANFSQKVRATVIAPIQMEVYSETADAVSTKGTTLDPSDYLKIDFKYSEGGKDPLSGESLRRALVNYIQTRDNFLSETDFYNIIEKYTTDFRLLFKKMVVQENVFYLQRALRDEYQNIIRSRNILPSVFGKTTSFSRAYFHAKDYGFLAPGIYYYKIYAYDRFDNIVSSEEIITSLVTNNSLNGSVVLQWDAVLGTVKYEVYGRTQKYDRKWETTKTILTDSGDEFVDQSDSTNFLPTFLDVPTGSTGLPNFSSHPYVLFPEFTTDSGQHFISPFLYKFNEFYNYYEGWLFYPELFINFAEIKTTADGAYYSANIPSIYLNLIYNKEQKKTTINLKSYQSLTGWVFYITIPELLISNAELEIPLNNDENSTVDDSTRFYDYTENDGLIIDPIVVTISASRVDSEISVFEATTAEITQRYDTTDLLQVSVFTYGESTYLVDVPVLDYDEFNSNKTLYLDKILSFINGFSFEENRMISDNLQFRMLNTDSIRSYLLPNCLIQGKNLYKDLNYIDNVIVKSISDSPEKIPLNKESWIINGTPLPILSTNVDDDILRMYQDMGLGLAASLTFLTESPYFIKVSGNYTTKFSAAGVIRVKDAQTGGVNGIYHILSSKYEDSETIIYLLEKIEPSINEGTLYYASYEPWRNGGPDNIATWDNQTETWKFTTLNVNDVITVSKPIYETYRYSSDYKFMDYLLTLPLNLSITIYTDREVVSRYGVNLEDQRKQIKLEIAKYLQLYMSGTDIVYYPSAIIEFVMEPRRIWIKGMTVKTTDSSNPPFEFKNGIETYPEYKIRDNISPSKMEILKYGSAFFWWNVDNIEIKYNLDG